MGPGCHFELCESIELCIVKLTRMACSSFSMIVYNRGCMREYIRFQFTNSSVEGITESF